MYFTKLIPLALAAAPIVAAAPFLEARQPSLCQQVLSELSQTTAYYESATRNWAGNAAIVVNTDMDHLKEAATSIRTVCAQLDQAIAGGGQSYQNAEGQGASTWQ